LKVICLNLARVTKGKTMSSILQANRARVMATLSVVAAAYLLFSTPSVRGAELAYQPATISAR